MSWTDVLNFILLIGNICVIAITIYTFRLGFFSKRVTVDMVNWRRSNSGDSISLILKNHSMRSFYIKKLIVFLITNIMFNLVNGMILSTLTR